MRGTGFLSEHPEVYHGIKGLMFVMEPRVEILTFLHFFREYCKLLKLVYEISYVFFLTSLAANPEKADNCYFFL